MGYTIILTAAILLSAGTGFTLGKVTYQGYSAVDGRRCTLDSLHDIKDSLDRLKEGLKRGNHG